MTKILDSLSSNFLTVTLKGTGGWSPNARIKGAEDVLATEYGGSSKAFKGTENILPAPHNAEYAALAKAFNAYRTKFYGLTMPYSHTTDPKTGKPQADGTRLLAARLLANGEFTNQLQALEQELDNARAAFASVIAYRVGDIQNEGTLGSRFDPSRYPDAATVLAGWRYEPVIPLPLADGSKLKGMSVPIAMVSAIEAQMEAQAASQIRFGQSQIAQEALDNVKTMAANLAKLDQWFTSQQGRRPSIYDSLVTNLQDSLTKLRTYAVANTEEGEKLLALADDIESRLEVGNLKADDFKTDHQVTRRTAKEASALSKDIESALDDLFSGGKPPVKTMLADPPAEVNVEPSAAPETDILETILADASSVVTMDAIRAEIAAHISQDLTLRVVQAEVTDLDELLAEWD